MITSITTTVTLAIDTIELIILAIDTITLIVLAVDNVKLITVDRTVEVLM